MVNNALLGSTLAYYQDILLDDVRIDEMPTCPKPLDLQVDAATFSSVDISWTPGDSETDWNVSWGAPGYTPGDGDEVGNASVTSPSYQITGLTENTYYDIYVQADCGSGDESMWVGPLTIYTGYCVPTSTGNTTRYIDGVVTQGALMNINNTGTGLSPDAYGDYTGTDTLRVFPGQEISVEFTHPSTTYHYKIWVDWDSDLNFDGPNDLIYATTSYQSSPHLVDITIPALTPEGVYRMRVRNSSTTLGGPCGNNASSETEDYILHIVSPPSCLPVSDIATTSATFQTSTITWTANNSETSWNISWGNPGYTPGDGDELGTDVSTSTTYQITGLTEDTHYDVYVQADCGGDESNWVGPLSVYTGYCVPTSTGNTTRYIDGVVTQGALMNINNTGTGLSPDAYGDYTGTDTLRVFPGQEISVEFTHPSTTYHYKIWVDWDSDLNFDGPNDLIYATTSYQSSPHLVDITIPALTPEGVYRMRVRNSSTTLGGPCGNNASSETEDYILHIVSPPSCLPVSDIATTSATFQTSTITWTANNSETSWNISWGNPGYTPGDGDELGTDVSTSTTYQITGLTEDTHYDVYVQADCGGDESNWVGPLSVYTGYCVPTSTGNTTRYIDGVVTQGALMNINNTGTGLSPDAYGDYTGTDTLRVFPGQEISVEFTHPSTTYHYKIWVDWDSDLNFDGPNDLIYATTSYQSSPHLVDITIPALTPEGVYRMRVRNSSTTLGGPCGNNASSETEDYILHIVSPPSCLPVSDIATTSATFQTSTITWTANNSETSWNISWGNPGYTPGDGDELGTDVSTSTTYQITGLTGDTHYDVYVQADCGGGDESIWAGPYTIFTGYCEVSTTNSSEYLIGIESDGAISDISYSATTQPAGSYANETAQLFRAFPGQTFEISSTYSGSWSNGVNIWVDWDQDLNFDATELWSYMSGSDRKSVV